VVVGVWAFGGRQTSDGKGWSKWVSERNVGMEKLGGDYTCESHGNESPRKS
jgi:hypothetical protein